MAKPGPKPKRAANPKWTPELAYVCGLMASDGCLYNDGRHLNLTSQDLEQLDTLKKCLSLTNKISWKPCGRNGEMGSQVQWGDVVLYKWFVSIGITPKKTFTLAKVDVPDRYFFDYLRGDFDGDGTSHAYWDTRWHSSVSLYIKFYCASGKHLEWINRTVNRLIGIEGVMEKRKRGRVEALIFSKTKAWPLYQAMYYREGLPLLSRKKEKLDRQWAALALGRQGKQPRGYIKGGPILNIA